MQNEITSIQPLLNEKGHLQNPGYAKKMLYTYDRSMIKASPLRIKEWDYYLITNDDFGIAFTIADNAYLGFVSISFLDFNLKNYTTFSTMKPFPMGAFHMPSTSETGDIHYQDKKISLSFEHKDSERVITFHAPAFTKNTPLVGSIVLSDSPEESMVIATPFANKPKAFYFNQKLNCMTANGTFTLGEKTYVLEQANAVLDWGRGVWTYDNTWYWGTCSSTIDGVSFGFNIGYGFGDTSNATENMIFYNGKAHKLNDVTFHIPKTANGRNDYLQDWTFTSSDHRFELTFTPILDRFDKINLLALVSDQHQVFGRVNGVVVLDDGTTLQVNNIIASAEVVHNRW